MFLSALVLRVWLSWSSCSGAESAPSKATQPRRDLLLCSPSLLGGDLPRNVLCPWLIRFVTLDMRTGRRRLLSPHLIWQSIQQSAYRLHRLHHLLTCTSRYVADIACIDNRTRMHLHTCYEVETLVCLPVCPPANRCIYKQTYMHKLHCITLH